MERTPKRIAVNGNFDADWSLKVWKLWHAAVKTIKLADLLDNTEDITLHDPKFARVYMAEKAALLPALQGGNELLWKQAEAQIARYHASL